MIGQNRYITILLLALTICMLLTACAYDAVNGEDDSMVSETANETTVTEIETDTTSVLDNETIDTTVDDSEQTTVIEQEPYDPEKEFDHLTHALTVYLEHLKYNFDMPNNNYETKMNHIKRGNQGLYVKFNSEEFYFVCAYFHSGHESEREDYCCKTLYTWVRFDNADEIVEYYGDNKFVVAFQINKSLFCKDILTMESATVNMEHYQTYMPVFVEGVNIAQGLTFGETYVYIYPNDMIFDYCLFQNPRMIYHSFDCYYHDWVVFRCVEIGDIDYLKVHLHYEREDGHSGDLNIHSEFGEYYEDLMRVMIIDQYSEYDKLGYRYDCGLFMIDDLISIIMNQGVYEYENFKNCKDGQHSDVSSLSLGEYVFDFFNRCGSNHDLEDGNMMAVASYGDKDYYKCKYCRYVAPFSSNVSQNYTAESVDETYHRCQNNVSGLDYTFVEEHALTDNGCLTCLYQHEHAFGVYLYHNNSQHIRACECGATQVAAHYVDRSSIINERYARCLGCYRLLDLQQDSAQIQSSDMVLSTTNGSYILSNGIVILVEADIEAYLNGTLQFYPANDLPQTQ